MSLSGTNPTQLAGIAAFSLAALSCLAARRRPWPTLALLHAVFLVEVLAGFRHVVHVMVMRAMGEAYRARTDYQLELFAVLLVAAAIGAAVLLRLRRRGPARKAVLATAALCLLFGIETISLHAVDAILYRQVGGIAIVGWLWLLAGGAVALLAWRSRRASKRSAR